MSCATKLRDSYAIGCDVRDPEMVCKAVQRVHDELGSVDVLVYNAGAGEWASDRRYSN